MEQKWFCSPGLPNLAKVQKAQNLEKPQKPKVEKVNKILDFSQKIRQQKSKIYSINDFVIVLIKNLKYFFPLVELNQETIITIKENKPEKEKEIIERNKKNAIVLCL